MGEEEEAQLCKASWKPDFLLCINEFGPFRSHALICVHVHVGTSRNSSNWTHLLHDLKSMTFMNSLGFFGFLKAWD